MHFPNTGRIYGAQSGVLGVWWCEPLDGVQKWNPKSSNCLKVFKTLKWLIFDCSIQGETPSTPCRYMYRDQDFSKIIGERTGRKTDCKELWLYLAAFLCQTTNQIYNLIRYKEWIVIKLIKVKKLLGHFLGAHTNSMVWKYVYDNTSLGMKLNLCKTYHPTYRCQ